MNFSDVNFVLSVHALRQLPSPDLPEIAFAGRSNVGKSSLINAVVGRKGMVKTSSKPGKTQGLNYFSVQDALYFVDLPGYGFARVSRKMQAGWQQLITEYLEQRKTLRLVVVVMDLRHPLKKMDRELVDWLHFQQIPCLPVYTKADKLSKNKRLQNAVALDSALGISSESRLIFSATSGLGLEELRRRLALQRDFC